MSLEILKQKIAKAGNQEAEYRVIHRVADKMRPRFRREFLAYVESIRGTLRHTELVGLLNTSSESAFQFIANIIDEQMAVSGLKDAIIETVIQAGTAAVAILPKEISTQMRFDLTNPASIEFINRQAGDMITSISNTTKNGIREILRQGFEGEKTVFSMAHDIKRFIGLTERQAKTLAKVESMMVDAGTKATVLRRNLERVRNKMIRDRAETIARTETINAANAGQHALWVQAQDEGLLTQDARKFWIVTPDDLLCPICTAIPGLNRDGRRLGEAFIVPSPVFSKQRPTAHPRCRCAMEIREPDEDLI